mgnify:FL=1
MLGVMLAAAVVLCSSPRSIFSTGDMLDVSQLNGREKYLASYGWVIDPASETERTVLLPKKFEGTVRDYADMQTDQGYDFAFYSGLECRQFTYEVTNYDGCDGTVDLVGGDHHLEGFIVQRYGFLHIVFAVFGSVSVSMKILSKGSAFCGIIPNLARETFVGEAGVRRPHGQRSMFRPRV